MSTADFLGDPWEEMHRLYKSSPINIRPAPETANGEVVLASVMRAVGFSGIAEGDVPRFGREFERPSRQGAGRPQPQPASSVSPETWNTVLHGLLESPKQLKQSSKRFLSLSPIVPDVAIYSGSARLAGNSWNPGVLVGRMVQLGAPSADAARGTWMRLFEALSVEEDDDIWARWVNQEFASRRRAGVDWQFQDLPEGAVFPPAVKSAVSYPARQFVHDLDAIIGSKSSMTRRQWTSLVESILRIGVVSHALWLCQVNHNLWSEVQDALRGKPVPPAAGEGVLTLRDTPLRLGTPSGTHIKELASRYLNARLGLNAVLWELAPTGALPAHLAGPEDFRALIELVWRERDGAARNVLEMVARLREEHARTLSCKKGIGSNMVDFARYVLGQRQPANDALRSYDQGYFQRKRLERSPWRVSIGPAALLAIVHCCLHGAAGPRSVQRLSSHLAEYGLLVDEGAVADGELGQTLRMLGLVLDSPDAESGMLLVPPFGGGSSAMEVDS